MSTAHLYVYTHCLKTDCFRSNTSLFLDSNISTRSPTYRPGHQRKDWQMSWYRLSDDVSVKVEYSAMILSDAYIKLGIRFSELHWSVVQVVALAQGAFRKEKPVSPSCELYAQGFDQPWSDPTHIFSFVYTFQSVLPSDTRQVSHIRRISVETRILVYGYRVGTLATHQQALLSYPTLDSHHWRQHANKKGQYS